MEQTFAENVYTLRGRAVHDTVDEEGRTSEAGIRVEHALPLYSERLGLVGKADVVEFHAGEVPYPVEYKQGKKEQHINDDLQLAAQAMCLEEMTGKSVRFGAIYHHSSRRRREVEITDDLRRQVAETVAAIRTMLAAGSLPAPVNDERCRHCSLRDACQPEAVAALKKLHEARARLFEPDAEV